MKHKTRYDLQKYSCASTIKSQLSPSISYEDIMLLIISACDFWQRVEFHLIIQAFQFSILRIVVVFLMGFVLTHLLVSTFMEVSRQLALSNTSQLLRDVFKVLTYSSRYIVWERLNPFSIYSYMMGIKHMSFLPITSSFLRIVFSQSSRSI